MLVVGWFDSNPFVVSVLGISDITEIIQFIEIRDGSHRADLVRFTLS